MYKKIYSLFLVIMLVFGFAMSNVAVFANNEVTYSNNNEINDSETNDDQTDNRNQESQDNIDDEQSGSNETTETEQPDESGNKDANTDQSAPLSENQTSGYKVAYCTYSQNLAWNSQVSDGTESGAIAFDYRMEGIKLKVGSALGEGNIQYRTHVSGIGWLNYVNGGEFSGTTGQSRAVEAVQMRLTGDISNKYDLYYSVYVADKGWTAWAKNDDIAGSTGYGWKSEGLRVQIVAKNETAPENASSVKYYFPYVSYSSQCQNVGWTNNVSDGTLSGTTGKALRLETVKMAVDSYLGSGSIQYSTHVQNVGWTDYSSNGEISGTVGRSLQIEAMKVRLTGELATKFDVYYHLYIKDKGWLGWTKDDETAGTTGLSYRAEAYEVKLVTKGGPAPETDVSNLNGYYSPRSVNCDSLLQGVGWQGLVSDGNASGTFGQSRRIEALKISLPSDISGNINYSTHVQDIGWQNSVSDGTMAGTTDQNKRVEAIKITLSGSAQQNYDVYYRAYCQNYGWLGWTSNGNIAGTINYGYRMEAYQVKLVPKGFSSETSVSYHQYYPNKQYYPTYMTQWDSRWGYLTYGGLNLSTCGCMPTSIAMSLTGILGNLITPNVVADYLYNNTDAFNKRYAGTDGIGVKYAAEYFGASYRGLGSLLDLNTALSSGNIVIAAVGRGNFVSGDYTHAIVLFGYGAGGYTNVYDPESPGKNGVYATGSLWNQQSTDVGDLRGGYVFHALSR